MRRNAHQMASAGLPIDGSSTQTTAPATIEERSDHDRHQQSQ
jgi:hypothetical protein